MPALQTISAMSISHIRRACRRSQTTELTVPICAIHLRALAGFWVEAYAPRPAPPIVAPARRSPAEVVDCHLPFAATYVPSRLCGSLGSRRTEAVGDEDERRRPRRVLAPGQLIRRRTHHDHGEGGPGLPEGVRRKGGRKLTGGNMYEHPVTVTWAGGKVRARCHVSLGRHGSSPVGIVVSAPSAVQSGEVAHTRGRESLPFVSNGQNRSSKLHCKIRLQFTWCTLCNR
jgi:hypothetical protein